MKQVFAVFSLFFAAACGPTVDLGKAVAAEAVTTGWAGTSAVAGRNKIVPAVSLRLKNVSDRKLGPLQVNAVVRRVNDPTEWSSAYLANVARELAPGGETAALTLVGQQGYTGTDDRDAMLRNSQFVDAKVEVYVKSGSSKWTRIGEYPIARELISAQNH
jgi:hypothetical protein